MPHASVPYPMSGGIGFENADYGALVLPLSLLDRVMVSAPSIDDTLGAILIGTYISLVLYGLALHQAYEYYVNYPYDKLWLKIYSCLVTPSGRSVLELACTVLTIHICYYYAVSSYADLDSLAVIVWCITTLALFLVAPLILTYTQVPISIFFLHRVWLIGRSYRPVVAVAFMFMMLELGVCFAYTVFGLRLKTWDNVAPKVWLVSVHNAASAVADLLVTWVLIYTLRQNQRRSMQRTNDMINDLILYAVSTGPSIYNIVCFIVSIALPQTLLYWATVLVRLKLYSNSLLAALNSRRSISARHPVGVTDTSPFGISVQPLESIELSKSTRHTFQELEGPRSAEGTVLEVKITQEVICDSEPSDSALNLKGDVEGGLSV
ncbi:hypothetical protein LXA43DRAFT_976344 [Ganoderma leucocontextum]|nr:hypothetical protein LXA43DRAFT_976344 [Ganoderma leucocontextum]